MKEVLTILILLTVTITVSAQPPIPQIDWVHLSSANGDLPVPSQSDQQTSCAVFDIDKDGINDFIVTERRKAPSVVWFKKNGPTWDKYILDADFLQIEAGHAFYDIDNDGDLDPVFGGESHSNELWWWENPYPEYNPEIPWKRHTIKKSGSGKHHDQIFADFDGDGLGELVFWNQMANTLFYAEIPENPREADEWDLKPIYTYSSDSEMPFPGPSPKWKTVNEHEGLDKADIDMDGVLDIVGGGWWFKHIGNSQFKANVIDASYSFSRSAAGQLIEGGRPEVILVVGDGIAPMNLYEWQKGAWVKKTLLAEVDNGHSIELIDFNGDGHLDIFNAEMRFGADQNTDAKCRILLGDGKGNFTDYIINEGFSNHESKIIDLDGDGDLDVLSKPFAHRAPGIDIFLQNGTGKPLSQVEGTDLNKPVGLQMYSLRHELEKDVPGTFQKVADMGFTQVELSSYYGYKPEEMMKMLKKLKLKVAGMIFGFDRFDGDMEGIIKEAKLFGAKYVGIGWLKHDLKNFDQEDAEFYIPRMNEFAAKCKKQGITFFYHFHGYEFGYGSNQPMLEYFMENLSADVAIEMDAMWTQYAGTDPVWMMQKYGERIKILHLKDMRWGVGPIHTGMAPDATSVPIGNGQVNFPALIRLAKEKGTELFIIEDEAVNASTQIPRSLEYLKRMEK